ncbi:hypothetical protein CSKR_104414 [Clonorchis sinensis]|uniref:Uncharacterized protein n=1 Tax=Clonorchis sinensis TaxID=79923 RepID=A0A419PLF6_CLOSI|nr:hypothetical protein CSKR_104414 [Clonorchis sinensis]
MTKTLSDLHQTISNAREANPSVGARRLMRLEPESTDWKIRGSNPASASRLPLCRLEQTGSILALVLPSGDMAMLKKRQPSLAKYTHLQTNLVLRETHLKPS